MELLFHSKNNRKEQTIMIEMATYTPEQMDILYTAVEEAVANHTAIDMTKIARIIKPGDFYLFKNATNGLAFTLSGLKWVQDGEAYIVLIQVEKTNDFFPQWYPTITVNDRTHSSSGNRDFIKKENRYISTSPGWVM